MDGVGDQRMAGEDLGVFGRNSLAAAAREDDGRDVSLGRPLLILVAHVFHY